MMYRIINRFFKSINNIFDATNDVFQNSSVSVTTTFNKIKIEYMKRETYSEKTIYLDTFNF